MKRNILILFIGFLIALLGFFLRLQKFESFPPAGDTLDELKSAFSGVNLIQLGIPKSWSWFDEYGNFPVTHIRNADFRIVEPWFDEPPLFGLIIGSYAISKGMDSLEKIDAGALRYPMLKLAALNIFLLFFLIFILKRPVEAILASLIYATEPTMVLGSRLPVAENLIVTTSLITLILTVLYFNKGKWWILALASVVAASSIQLKSTGIFVPGALILILISFKKFKETSMALIFLIISLAAWFFYGYIYNFQLFLTLISVSSGRELLQPTNIINLFEVFRIGEKTMSVDGWIVWGWVAVVVYSFIDKRENKLNKLILPVTLGSYLIFFMIMSGHLKGWYRLPFYPFLSWASAVLFIETFRNPRLLLSIFFLSIPVASSYIYGTGEYYWNAFDKKVFQIVFPLMLLPSMLYEISGGHKIRQIAQVVLAVGFAGAIIFNFGSIYYFQDQFWY